MPVRTPENGGRPIQTRSGFIDPISVGLSKPCSCGRKLNWSLDRYQGVWQATCCSTYQVPDIFRVVTIQQ